MAKDQGAARIDLGSKQLTLGPDLCASISLLTLLPLLTVTMIVFLLCTTFPLNVFLLETSLQLMVFEYTMGSFCGLGRKNLFWFIKFWRERYGGRKWLITCWPSQEAEMSLFQILHAPPPSLSSLVSFFSPPLKCEKLVFHQLLETVHFPGCDLGVKRELASPIMYVAILCVQIFRLQMVSHSLSAFLSSSCIYLGNCSQLTLPQGSNFPSWSLGSEQSLPCMPGWNSRDSPGPGKERQQEFTVHFPYMLLKVFWFSRPQGDAPQRHFLFSVHTVLSSVGRSVELPLQSTHPTSSFLPFSPGDSSSAQ